MIVGLVTDFEMTFTGDPLKMAWQLTFFQTSPGLYISAIKVFFSTVFSTCLENFLPLSSNLKLSSAKSLSLEESKFCCLGKG